MPDVVVTVPKTFRWGNKVGLAAWVAEGGLPGETDPDEADELYGFSTWGPRPDVVPGDRVYVVCEGKVRGYAPLVALEYDGGRVTFVRGGGAVAVTIPQPVTGFRGWRYRWWPVESEVPFPEWATP